MKYLFFFLAVSAVMFSSETFCYALTGDTTYNGAVEDAGQSPMTNAQSTLASLFGERAVIPIPPQIGHRATIAIPSFDSKDLKIEKNDLFESD